ncbi:Signal transduction histidine kinase [Maridesulfovibrio ferrireducens]|uniref:Signal transduction histidine kinase n=1 Tax=Maridesulfovibrio ferrireducens TaxID=246191 RepID=A0A1G9BT84_9BACT|nr:HAMP domain-containing sensor histidine kinase [Maridesulfovibrio ferrireducens]SDK42657.1 Signal transduction histidine kinase [Maridesulfovibrio ferrireducens]
MNDAKKSADVYSIKTKDALGVGVHLISEVGPEELLIIQRRVHEKMDDYKGYSFSTVEKRALMIFFDLAQEFDKLEEFFTVCTSVPKVLFGVDCRLYIAIGKDEFVPVGGTEAKSPICTSVPLEKEFKGGHLFIPIRGNHDLIGQLDFKPSGDVIGCFEIYNFNDLSDHQSLFFEKFVNRIGFQLHSKLLRRKGQEHLEFVRNLVKDVGHNVIVPNMYFKLFYNRLRDRIENIQKLSDELDSKSSGEIKNELNTLYAGLVSQFNEIHSHYEQTSLFLETLLRRRHFEEGRYIVEKRPCNLLKQIIEPQLERYKSRFEERGIRIDMSMGGVPDREVRIVADVGLISQVYANLFSNAVKYTREVVLHNGSHDKFTAYGWDHLKKFFENGWDGLKLNVFTSGPPLSLEDSEKLFQAGFRCENTGSEYGSGHGLFFVRQVVELHGGKVGYESGERGNNFYFILPFGPE